jgi:hypothetical protein
MRRREDIGRCRWGHTGIGEAPLASPEPDPALSGAMVGRVTCSRRPQISWLPSLTRQGSGSSLVVNGPVDREVFDSFVTGTSVPALRPEQVLVLHWPQGGKAVLYQAILLSWTQAVASASMARSTSP